VPPGDAGALADTCRRLLEHGDLEMGHARALLALEGEQQSRAAREVSAKGYSVRETEQLVSGLRGESRKRSSSESGERAGGFDLGPYSKVIKEHIPFRVKVKRGSVEIELNDEDELKSFLKRFSKK